MAEGNKFGITLALGDKRYTLQIERSDEEKIRKAAKNVTETYKKYRLRTADPMDAMAMVALQTSIDLIDQSPSEELSEMEKDLAEIDSLLEESLK